MKEKKKILVIADSPLVPSGVGSQTKYMIESLLETGEYKFFCLAGAIKHSDYRLQKVSPYMEDWLIQPVNGYGDSQIIRAILNDYKPDVLWFMTDPRFFHWLWKMEDEIRKNVPMVYYHVWDNFPAPKFNKKFYESTDVICTISKVTDQIVEAVAPEVERIRIPHAVDTKVFTNTRDSKEVNNFRKLITKGEDKTVFFWNNRNARRKHAGTLIYCFKEFLDIVGHDKATLLMHTEPKDPNGPDLQVIVDDLNLNTHDQVLFSIQKLESSMLADVYSASDCTINISDAEGFGLSTLESLACETPIIVNMTGGLQEQITDGENWFGFGIEPSSKTIVGSQDVPYVYEDRINTKEFVETLLKFYHLDQKEKLKMGSQGRQHVLKNYGLEQFASAWKRTISNVIDKHGSWENRKNYKPWYFGEIEK